MIGCQVARSVSIECEQLISGLDLPLWAKPSRFWIRSTQHAEFIMFWFILE